MKMNISSFSQNPGDASEIAVIDRAKTFVLPGKCFERRAACCWRRGNKFSIFSRSQTTSQNPPETSDDRILNIRQDILIFHPILRKLVNESNGTFLSLQKAAEASKSLDNHVEFLKHSRQYRSIIRVCIENLQEAASKESNGVEKNNLLTCITIFYSIECVWHLCEILYVDNVPGDYVLPFLLEWVRFHFPCHEQMATQLLDACERGSEENPEYWDTVIGMIVQGRVDVARALLKLHSATDSTEFKLVDNSLKSMPIYSVYGGISTGEFTITWKHWQAECRSKISSQSVASQPQLELILRLVTGDYSAFESILSKYDSWLYILGGWTVFTMPWAKRHELRAAASACAGMRGAGRGALHDLLRPAVEGELHQVIHEIQQISDNSWFATHLTDILYHCGKLKILDKHQIDVTDRLRDSLILEFGSLLMEHTSLWAVGLSYLCSCAPAGPARAELLLSRLPIPTETRALRVASEASKYGLHSVGELLEYGSLLMEHTSLWAVGLSYLCSCAPAGPARAELLLSRLPIPTETRALRVASEASKYGLHSVGELLEYGSLLMEHTSLWAVGLSYLCSCAPAGPARAELLLSRLPIPTETRALRVASEASKYGLHSVGELLEYGSLLMEHTSLWAVGLSYLCSCAPAGPARAELLLSRLPIPTETRALRVASEASKYGLHSVGELLEYGSLLMEHTSLWAVGLSYLCSCAPAGPARAELLLSRLPIPTETRALRVASEASKYGLHSVGELLEYGSLLMEHTSLWAVGLSYLCSCAPAGPARAELLLSRLPIPTETRALRVASEASKYGLHSVGELLEYGSLLMEHTSLWAVGLSYLCSCAPAGPARAELLLSRLPIPTETRALRVASEASKYGLHSVGELLEYGSLLMEHTSLWAVGLSYLCSCAPAGPARAELLLSRLPIPTETRALRVASEASKYGLHSVGELLEYGSLLMEHTSLWAVGLSYLCSCAPAGPARAELLLSRLPIPTETRALRVASEASKYGLHSVVRTICACVGARHLSAGRLGAALAWGMRGRSSALCARAADAALRAYTASGQLPARDLLPAAGTGLLLHHRALLLGKYCDFHRFYKNREFRKAAKLLISLLTSKIAPDYFWETLLLDTLPLLESDEPVFSSADTFDIMLCVELRAGSLAGERAELLRLACARNLARSLLQDVKDEQ